MTAKVLLAIVCLTLGVAVATARFNEVKIMPGHTRREHVLSPRPHEYMSADDLPENWDWRNISGVSYVTRSLNQHIPVYCGSCWAHAAMSSFADRIKILRKAAWPDITPSIQVILNCGTQVAGSCVGGTATGAFQFVQDIGGIPDDTCQQYQAQDFNCSAINTCRSCSGNGTCSAVETYPVWQISEYGTVQGAVNMQLEIYARGPIAVGIDAGPLHQYTGGVLWDKTGAVGIDHIVSIVGWGVSTGQPGDNVPAGTPYWIVRNSWGTYWGEDGWFRIVRGINNCAIEKDGAWAVPFNFPL